MVRELKYEDAVDGKNYPQTPMQIYVGAWAAGDPRNKKGVIEWAQDVTDFDKGPWTMYVKSVHIQDYSTGAQYVYSDKTGSYQSINIVP